MASVARNFVGASNQFVALTTGGIQAATAITVAAVIKRTTAGTTQVIMSAGSGGADFTFFLNASNFVTLAVGGAGNQSGATAVSSTSVWYLVVAGKSTGTTTPRMSIYNYSTKAWVHENAGGTLINGTAPTNAWIGIDNGASSGASWNGNTELVGYWNSNLTDAQRESLANDGLSWMRLSPRGLWYLNQPATGTNVVDNSGFGANQSSVTGTAVTIGNPDFDQPPVLVNPVVPGSGGSIMLPFPMGIGEILPFPNTEAAGAVAADLGTLRADIVTAATLAVTAQTGITLATSTIQTAATLNLTAPALLTLSSAAIQTAATLNLTAPAKLTLSSAAIQTSATLFVTAQTYITQGTSAIQTSATLALSAPTTIPLGSAALVFGQGGLKVTEAPTQVIAQQSDVVFSASLPGLFTPRIVPLDPAAIQTSATLALTAPGILVLSTAAIQTSASLNLTAKTTITLATSAIQTSATLALTAPALITLGTSAIVTSATLNLTAPAKLTLATSTIQTSATLALTAPAKVVMGTSAAAFSASLFLTAQTYVVLSTSSVVTAATLINFSSGTPLIPMQQSNVVTTATLSLVAQTYVVLTTAALLTAASLTVTTPAAPSGEGFGMVPFLILLDDDD